MKIVICTNYFYPHIGGSEVVCLALAKHLAKQHQVYVLTRKIAQRKSTDVDGIKILEYATTDASILVSTLKKIQPDAMFIYSDLFDYFRHFLSNPVNTKIIIGMCGANWVHKNPGYANLFVKNLRNIHKLVCHSTLDRDYTFCQSVSPDKTTVIPNGVDLDEFDTNKLSRADLAPEIADRVWILNVSNFFPGKGQELIPHILPLVNSSSPLAYLQIYHDLDFPLGKELENKWMIQTQSLRNSNIIVKPLKNISRDRVIGFFKQSNAFAFTTKKEVAPLVLLEAMASELPWVSTDVGNAKELHGGRVIHARKDSNQYSVFDNRVYSEFAGAIKDVVTNPNIAALGRKQIEHNFNWSIILPEYSYLLEE